MKKEEQFGCRGLVAGDEGSVGRRWNGTGHSTGR